MEHCAQRNTIDGIMNDLTVFNSQQNNIRHYNEEENYFQDMDGYDIQALVNDELNYAQPRNLY